jgi:hypothetical protein
MAKSREEMLKDLRAGGYSEGSIRNWLINQGLPPVAVDKLMALRTAKDAVTNEDRIRALRKIEPHSYQTPKRGSANLPCVKCGLRIEAPEHQKAKDSADRRSRLHRALDCVLDRKAAKDFKPQGRECDACGAHLDEKNFTAPGSWSYKCPRCRFNYNHSSSKSVDEQLKAQHKTHYRDDD